MQDYYYKYFSKICRAIASIENGLHLDDPNTYNDYYDGRIIVDELVIGEERFCDYFSAENFLKKTKQFCYIEDDFAKQIDSEDLKVSEVINKICEKYPQTDRNQLIKLLIAFSHKNKMKYLDNMKTTCLSEEPDSLLMWSYYGNAFKGVCIEYCTLNSPDIIKNIKKVKYSETIKKADFPFCKSSVWQHEKEWRISISTDKEWLSDVQISSVIIGDDINVLEKQRVFLAAINHNISIKKAVPIVDEYGKQSIDIRTYL